MRRLINLLMILIGISATALSAADTADFEITAFKVGYDGMRVVVNNRLNQEDVYTAEVGNSQESVPSVNSGSIVLNDALSYLLGDTNTDASKLSAHVVFSYRVEGTRIGKFTLSMTLPCLTHTDGEHTMDVLYQMGNYDVMFEPSVNYYTITHSATENSNKATKDSPVTFSMPITVTSNNGQTGTTSGTTWIARGAVGMVIDNAQYRNNAVTPYGTYTAPVKITLTSGE